jgi:hypothetical protein
VSALQSGSALLGSGLQSGKTAEDFEWLQLKSGLLMIRMHPSMEGNGDTQVGWGVRVEV